MPWKNEPICLLLQPIALRARKPEETDKYGPWTLTKLIMSFNRAEWMTWPSDWLLGKSSCHYRTLIILAYSPIPR